MDAREVRAALDLLLMAGDTVEKVHQVVWFALLKHSNFLMELGVPMPEPHRVEWEPEGRLFDLAARTDKQGAWIELKLDSELSYAQIERQCEYAKMHGGRAVHALLGLSGIRARPAKVDRCEKLGGLVVGPAQVIAALRRVQASEPGMAGVRGLAQAYADSLEALSKRGHDFRTTSDKGWWLAHSAYFYDSLRRDCPHMAQAVVEYVPNASGGFEAFHWGWTDAGKARCYLQWEDRRLCVKILVEQGAARGALRSAAVSYLKDRTLEGWPVSRPRRLGSGRTMTVGVLDDLPVRDESKWAELQAVVAAGTSLVEAMAAELTRVHSS